jgi:hypothetical protein
MMFGNKKSIEIKKQKEYEELKKTVDLNLNNNNFISDNFIQYENNFIAIDKKNKKVFIQSPDINYKILEFKDFIRLLCC